MVGLHSVFIRVALAALFASAPFVFINAQFAQAGDDDGGEPVNLPLILKDGRSLNWAGYAVSGLDLGAVSEVKGTWRVPSVDCTGIVGDAHSSAWVGIDGYLGATVQQIGTRHNCVDGSPRYSAFYELFPLPPVILDLRVRPGDRVRASVEYAGLARYELTLKNLTTDRTFSTTKTFVAPRQSAEWIVERPMSGQLTALADFGAIEFKNISATVNGREGDPRNAKSLTMSSLLGATLGEPSSIQDGDTFKVYWRRSQ